MSELILEQLFESPIKLKLLKLFLRNPDKSFSLQEVIRKTQSNAYLVKRQLRGLESIGLLNEKQLKTNKAKDIKGGTYFSVNSKFDFYAELQSLILKSSPTSKEKMLRRLNSLGRIKMALISGVFLNTDNYRIDLFLVGDDISQNRLHKFLKEMESEVGKEIEYAAMETKEFEYRYQMFDRFVRDVMEKPHEKLINKLKFME